MLPAPNLDDRNFQDLVDEAKRIIQRRWPKWTAWTDHNVSDPGVTLIETVAYMVDQLIYRLNRVPELHYVKFLELIGIRLHPPTAATAPTTFWLTGVVDHDVVVPAQTEVATPRLEGAGSAGVAANGQTADHLGDAVVFRTMTPLTIVASAVKYVGRTVAGGSFEDMTAAAQVHNAFTIFGSPPSVGDALYIGLERAAPECVVALRFGGPIEGYGVNPDRPPRRWEAWTPDGWADCEVFRDDTGGFNRVGDVVLALPAKHGESAVGQLIAGWMRCTVAVPSTGEETYRASPRIDSVAAMTLGGTVRAKHAEEVLGEVLGRSEGVAGQRFSVLRPPVLPEHEVIVEIITERADDGAGGGAVAEIEEWTRVDSFAHCLPETRAFTLDPASGVIAFGPAARLQNGEVRQYGAIPPSGCLIRARSYVTGGGRIGNVAAGALRVLKTAIPNIRAVENRVQATGGVDGESIDEAKLRGPLELRSRGRAVTLEDFEQLTREAAPSIARVRCLDVSRTEPGTVRVLVVPNVSPEEGLTRIRVDQLRPSDAVFERIVAYLEERRVIGTRVVVEVPQYTGCTVAARVRAQANTRAVTVSARAVDALYRYFHPLIGGPDGRGWPFGRPIQVGEVYSVLSRVRGVDFVEEAYLFPFNVVTGQPSNDPVDRIDVPPNGLAVSFAHDIRVDEQ